MSEQVDQAASAPSPVRTHRFDDCEQLAEFLVQARVEYHQVSPGRFRGSITGLDLPGGVLLRNLVGLKTIYRVAAAPGKLYWHVIPSWKGTLTWNGMVLDRPTLTQHGGGDDWIRSGTDIEGIALMLPSAPLEAAAAAIAGIASGEGTLASGPLRHSAATQAQAGLMLDLAKQMTVAPAAFARPPAKLAVERALASAAIDTLVEQLWSPAERPRPGPDRRRIVRLAEERFEAAAGGPISLADLCLATGVSARTLDYTFHALCGVSPLRYFKLRRLGIARRLLRNGPADRGAVKRAALTAGLTELGRFAAEYRALFGESPSATLTRIRTLAGP